MSSSSSTSTSSSGWSPQISRKRVSFGNPALGTYKGSVYTIPNENLQNAHRTSSAVSSSPPSVPPLVEGAEAVQKMVAMIGVPPEHVPESLMDLIRCHRPFIEHVRVVIAENDDGDVRKHDEIAREHTKQDDKGDEQEREQQSQLLSSNSIDENDEKGSGRTYLVLFRMTREEDAENFVDDLNAKPYIAFNDQETCSVEHVVALQGDDGVSLLNPHFAPSMEVVNSMATDATTTGKSSSPTSRSPSSKANSKPSASVDDQNCAVCLERLVLLQDDQNAATAKTSILTTVCNHTFHLDCLQQWSGPCIVCRFDHSGLNETLSQCHVCGTTEHNYVCLICGCISCVGTPSAAGEGVASATSASASGSSNDGASSFHTSHAGQHYSETLHAYALDTQNQHVYDFAGQGYVHRIVQSKDGKLVEINDPSSSSQERSIAPGLSQAQEGEVVHRKLEGFASQYYTLLKSQLEQQRTFYEQRLQQIRREFAMKERNNEKSRVDLRTVLRQERKQLAHRLQSIQRKKDSALKDSSFLKSMNESLEANKPGLDRHIQQAQSECISSREMIQKYVPALEEKVAALMLQLEESLKES